MRRISCCRRLFCSGSSFRPLRGADRRLCQGTDSLPEVVLGVFPAGRDGRGHVASCVRQSCIRQRSHLRLDRRGQSVDVRRPACDATESAHVGAGREGGLTIAKRPRRRGYRGTGMRIRGKCPRGETAPQFVGNRCRGIPRNDRCRPLSRKIVLPLGVAAPRTAESKGENRTRIEALLRFVRYSPF